MKRNYFGTVLTLLAMILIGASVTANAQVQTAQAQFRNALDFDGDGKADVTVMRYGSTSQPMSGYTRSSSNGSLRGTQFGSAYSESNGGTYDYPAAGDYDGDGKADVAVVRLSGGTQPKPAMWYILQSGTNTVRALAFGNGSRAGMPGLQPITTATAKLTSPCIATPEATTIRQSAILCEAIRETACRRFNGDSAATRC